MPRSLCTLAEGQKESSDETETEHSFQKTICKPDRYEATCGITTGKREPVRDEGQCPEIGGQGCVSVPETWELRAEAPEFVPSQGARIKPPWKLPTRALPKVQLPKPEVERQLKPQPKSAPVPRNMGQKIPAPHFPPILPIMGAEVQANVTDAVLREGVGPQHEAQVIIMEDDRSQGSESGSTGSQQSFEVEDPLLQSEVSSEAVSETGWTEVAGRKHGKTKIHSPKQPQPKPKAKITQQKMVLCKFFAEGRCSNGASCPYAHGEHQLQQQNEKKKKTEMCSYFINGTCANGEHCMYAHGLEELQPQPLAKTKTKLCLYYNSSRGCDNGDSCRFAHGQEELRLWELRLHSTMRQGTSEGDLGMGQDTKSEGKLRKRSCSPKIQVESTRDFPGIRDAVDKDVVRGRGKARGDRG